MRPLSPSIVPITPSTDPQEEERDLSPGEMLDVMRTRNRHARRAFEAMRRHGVPVEEAFERCSGFASRRMPKGFKLVVDAGPGAPGPVL